VKRLNVKAEFPGGKILESSTTMKDYILWETTAKRQKPPWGTLTDNPTRWEAFITWAALRRTEQYSAGFETFMDEAEIVEASAPEVEVEPTTGDPGDG
jgi:hypothetical protein